LFPRFDCRQVPDSYPAISSSSISDRNCVADARFIGF